MMLYYLMRCPLQLLLFLSGSWPLQFLACHIDCVTTMLILKAIKY
jgi:hypothetical protein